MKRGTGVRGMGFREEQNSDCFSLTPAPETPIPVPSFLLAQLALAGLAQALALALKLLVL